MGVKNEAPGSAAHGLAMSPVSEQKRRITHAVRCKLQQIATVENLMRTLFSYLKLPTFQVSLSISKKGRADYVETTREASVFHSKI